MIINVASFPRSGNSLFQIHLWRRFGIQTTDIYKEGGNEDLGHFHTAIDERLPYKYLPTSHVWVKTHSPPHAKNDDPTVLVIRHPCAVYCSLAHMNAYLRETDYAHEIAQLTTAGAAPDTTWGYSWSKHGMAWKAVMRTRAVVRYEDIVADPSCLGPVVESVTGQPAQDKGEYVSFEELHALYPVSYRRGDPDGWKDELTSQQIQMVKHREKEGMQAFGYE